MRNSKVFGIFWEIESEVFKGYSYTFGFINTIYVCVNRANQSFLTWIYRFFGTLLPF